MKTKYLDHKIASLELKLKETRYLNRHGRDMLSEFKAIKRALSLFDVSDLLPENYWFSDENDNDVTVLLTIGDTCMVSSDDKEAPYALPLEFVMAIYTDTLIEGNNH
jgi:hypothetical protein